jgi:hypothetical protein
MQTILYSLNTFPKDASITEKISKTNYRVLNSTSTELIDHSEHTEDTGIYRSVITDLDGNLLCFSPTASIPFSQFKEQYPWTTSMMVNEIIEGTMINLFYDKKIESWEIATKNSVGGEYWYYRNQYPDIPEIQDMKETTFRKMFLEAIQSLDSDINNNDFIRELDKSYSYSFVLQHPNNHIVNIIKSPTIYLVAIFEIIGNTARYIMHDDWPIIHLPTLRFPKLYHFSTYEELEQYSTIYKNPDINDVDSYQSIGLMILNRETGLRTCIENTAYQYVKDLRGNNPNLKFQYLSLRKNGRVDEFLSFFPKYIPHFNHFSSEYSNFIKEVHNGYVTYYVNKSGVKISKKYFPLVYKLHHTVYLPSLDTESPVIIKKNIVADFIENCEPKTLIYYLNWTENNCKK